MRDVAIIGILLLILTITCGPVIVILLGERRKKRVTSSTVEEKPKPEYRYTIKEAKNGFWWSVEHCSFVSSRGLAYWRDSGQGSKPTREEATDAAIAHIAQRREEARWEREKDVVVLHKGEDPSVRFIP